MDHEIEKVYAVKSIYMAPGLLSFCHISQSQMKMADNCL